MLIRYRPVVTFRRRGAALLLGLATGALLIGGMATAAPVSVLPAAVQTALGAAAVVPTDVPSTGARPMIADAADTRATGRRADDAPTVPTRTAIALDEVPVIRPPEPTPTPEPTTAPPTPIPEPTATPAARVPVATPAPTRAASGGATDTVVALTNDARADAGCAPLRTDGRITDAAQAHSEDMAAKSYFSHDSRDGRDFADRIRDAGYPSPGAENIAQGQRSAAEVVEAWMNSPGHRRNIEDCSLTTIGVGLAGGDFYWTQDFGR